MTKHLSESQLFQLFDGARDQLAPETLIHIESCTECRTRVTVLQRRSERFTELLRQTDPAVPAFALATSTHVGRRLAVAAGVAVLLAGSLLVQPVRAWIVAQGRAVLQRVSSSAVEQPASPLSPDLLESRDGSGVSFRPQGAHLTIDVTTHQANGTIVVRRGDTPDVVANVTNATVEDGLTVLPFGVRFENSRESVAMYDVKVPRMIELVEIVVADQMVARIRTGPEFDEQVVDLTVDPSK